MQKRGVFWVILVIVLVFGMAVVGCEDDEKKDYSTFIKITGITEKTGLASVMIYSVFNGTADPVAGGQGIISNNEVIVTLKDTSQNNWGGVGNSNQYHVFIVFGDDTANRYAWTSNRDWTGMGGLGITNETSLFANLPKWALYTFNEHGAAFNNLKFDWFRNIADIDE